MLALNILIGAMVLTGFGYVLRRPPPGLWRGVFGFVFAFTLTAASIGIFAKKNGIVREDAYGHIAAHALVQINQNPLPYILFVGASYSRNALDDQLLSRQLQSAGYPVQVINFALEGASLQERDLRLRQVLAAAPRPPEMIFFEISKRFDDNPAYGFEVAKFSNRVIGQFDGPGSMWAARGLLEQRRQLGIKTLAKDAVLLGLHAPINLGNIGLFAGGGPLDGFAPGAAYDPQTIPRKAVNEQERNHGLLAPNRGLAPAAPPWANAFRAKQAAFVQSAGVKRIGYYFPPVIDADERAYVAARCAQYAHCIAPTDIEMLAKLDGEYWFDHEHLLAKGAQIYTKWLAHEMITRNVLLPPSPAQKLALVQALGLRR